MHYGKIAEERHDLHDVAADMIGIFITSDIRRPELMLITILSCLTVLHFEHIISQNFTIFMK